MSAPTPSQNDAFAQLMAAARSAGLPSAVIFQVTDKCNYRCVHCYQEHTHKKELGTGEVIGIFDQIAELGVLFLTLMGGEFFVRKDADELLSAAHDRGFAIKLLTTGHHVDDRRADHIASLQPIRVDLSVYGPNADIHDSVTERCGSWERTVAAAKRLVERGVRVEVKSPVMNVNADSLPELADLAESLGAHASFDTMVTGMENGELGPTSLRARDEQLAEFFADRRAGIWESLVANAHVADEQLPVDATPCQAGQAVLGINPQGHVWPCNSLPVDCGDLRETTLRDIWFESQEMLRIRHLKWSDIPECRVCELRRHCSRCHAVAMLEDGRLAGPALESCRQAVIKRDLLRERGLVSAEDTAMPPTWDRVVAQQRGVRPGKLRILP